MDVGLKKWPRVRVQRRSSEGQWRYRNSHVEEKEQEGERDSQD